MILMPSYVFCEIENCIVYLFSCNVYHCPTNPCISIFIYFEIPCIMDNFYSTKSRTEEFILWQVSQIWRVLLFKLSNEENYSRGYFHNIIAWIFHLSYPKWKKIKNNNKKRSKERKKANCSKNKKQKIAPLQQDSTFTPAYILFWYK